MNILFKVSQSWAAIPYPACFLAVNSPLAIPFNTDSWEELNESVANSTGAAFVSLAAATPTANASTRLLLSDLATYTVSKLSFT